MQKPIHRALKLIVVPRLRQIGFKGPYPNFYRKRGRHIDLLHLQFQSFYFFCEIPYTDQEWQNISWDDGEEEKSIYISARSTINLSRNSFDPKQIRMFMTNKRLRLDCLRNGQKDDTWLFESVGEGEPQDPVDLAEELRLAIDNQAENWWRQQYTE